MKIIIYCQHILGIGHLFRTLEICNALVGHDIILVTGGPVVDVALPVHVREIRLPQLHMDADFSGLLTSDKNSQLDQVKANRQQRLFSIFEAEQPEVFIVELYPFGRKAFRFELDPVLEAIHDGRLSACGVFSSIRDILVEKEDQDRHEARALKILNRYFDGVLVHADSELAKIEETFFHAGDIRIPVVYTGFIAPQPAADARQRLREYLKLPPAAKLIVASAGSGSVGAPLLDAVCRAFRLLGEDSSTCHLQIFSGPFMAHNDFERLKKETNARVTVSRFTDDFLAYLAAADLSVSMGGYNTSMNILATRVPALVWPFDQNREQRMRAERLAEIGAMQLLNNSDLEPGRLAALMLQVMGRDAEKSIEADLNGADHTALWIVDWARRNRKI